jgi:polyisoprenoid-binding protein YceI
MSTQVDIPGYVAGTWVIDAARSDVSFRVRQAGISTVRGCFDEIEGTIVTAADPRDSSVTAVIRAASINTRNPRRDKHLRTDDFLASEQHPALTFTSTAVRADGGTLVVEGDLTVRGVTKPVTLPLEVTDFGAGRVRFTTSTGLNRTEYGVTGGASGAVIGKDITIDLAIEADQQG